MGAEASEPFVPFELECPRGVCVGVDLPDWSTPVELSALPFAGLAAAELDFARAADAARRVSFLGGRVALQRALELLGAPRTASLPNARGAPDLPSGFVGSISHKQRRAVAWAARGEGGRLGVDLEELVSLRPGLARHILSERERRELAGLSDEDLGTELLWRFSAKEAIYKALDPFVSRYVAFREVSLRRRADVGFEVELCLASPGPPLEVEVSCTRVADYCLSFARASPRLESSSFSLVSRQAPCNSPSPEERL